MNLSLPSAPASVRFVRGKLLLCTCAIVALLAPLSAQITMTDGQVLETSGTFGSIMSASVTSTFASSTIRANGPLTFGGYISVAGGGSYLTLDTNGHTITVGIDAGANSIYTNTAGVIKTGAGLLALNGKINGSLSINQGEVSTTGFNSAGVNVTNSTLTASSFSPSAIGGVNLNGGGTFKAGAAFTSSGSASLTLSAADTAFDTNGYNVTFGQSISGTGTLNKTGAGTLTVTNPTHTGGTTISAGTLALASTGSIAASPLIALASGATFDVSAVSGGFAVGSGQTLSGSGTVTGALTIASGGLLAPGNSPGTMHLGSTTFGGGGTYLWEMNSGTGAAGADPGWDFLNITGALNITATSGDRFTIDLTSLTLGNAAGLATNFDNTQNHSYLIASASGGITGFSADKFDLDLSGFLNDLAGGAWDIVQSGNSLNLEFSAASAIPEPSTYAMLFGVAVLGLAIFRRRNLAQP